MNTQREVTDAGGISWTCIQAYAGLGDRGGKEEAARIKGSQDVAVVCTPSGGAHSVRLKLPPDWAEMDEATLLTRIDAELRAT